MCYYFPRLVCHNSTYGLRKDQTLPCKETEDKYVEGAAGEAVKDNGDWLEQTAAGQQDSRKETSYLLKAVGLAVT